MRWCTVGVKVEFQFHPGIGDGLNRRSRRSLISDIAHHRAKLGFRPTVDEKRGSTMYSTIMVPVDLAHADTVEKALITAGDLGKYYHARVVVVGVAHTAPGSVAHNPEEYGQKLQAFTQEYSNSTGCPMEARTVICNDPAVELDDALAKTGKDLGADLVVMASHVPSFRDHLYHANATYLAGHVDYSVFIVR